MNASQLHQWVLRNVRLAASESIARLDSLHGDHSEFMREAGKHAGILQVEGLLLDLVVQMQDDERTEREARWAEEDERHLRGVG